MTKDFRSRGLIVNDATEEYDGTTAVVRSEHLSAEDIEFMRWRAERWMKLRHFPPAVRHYPWFVLRNGRRMLRAHVSRQLVAIGDRPRECAGGIPRYKAIRRAERHYLGANPDGQAQGAIPKWRG